MKYFTPGPQALMKPYFKIQRFIQLQEQHQDVGKYLCLYVANSAKQMPRGGHMPLHVPQQQYCSSASVYSGVTNKSYVASSVLFSFS